MPTVTFSPKRKVWTDEELEALPKDGHKYELLDGGLIMSPVPANHSIICVRLGSLLFSFVEPHKLGEVYDSSLGRRLSPELLLILIFHNRVRPAKLIH